QPASVASFVNATTSSSTSRRSLVSQSIWHPECPQERSIVLSGNVAHLLLRPRVEWVGQRVDAQRRPPTIGGHRVGQRLELVGHPLERSPRPVVADPHHLAGELAGVGPRPEVVLGRRGGGVEHLDASHARSVRPPYQRPPYRSRWVLLATGSRRGRPSGRAG